MTKLSDGWKEVALGDIINYEQPTEYIVDSDDYNDEYKTPVLTAGKSFILGYTNEKEGAYNKLPVIIFDDFTTASKFVTFPFKVKSSAMKLLTPKTKEVDLKFVFWLMQTIKVDSTTHKRYYLSNYQHIKIHLPPLQTQQKIVSILEKAEKAKEWRKDADELTKDYLKSVFMEMFGDPAKNPQRFKIEIMSDLLAQNREGTKCGPFGSALKKEEYVQNGVPVWTMDNIQDNKFIPDSCLYISKKKYEELKAYSTISGDIIISRAGTVGKMCVVDTEFPNSIISTNLIRLSLNHHKILPIYFTSLMIYCEGSVGRLKTGAEGAYTFMNTGILKKLKIPLPPIELQQKFAAIVARAEEIKEHQKQSKEQIDNLFNVLMQKAFKGGLVV